MGLLPVTPEEWEQEVGSLLKRDLPYLDPGVSSYLAGVLAHPETALSTHEQLRMQHALALAAQIRQGDTSSTIASKLKEKAGHLVKVGEGCLVISTFHRPSIGTLPVIPLGEASYRRTAVLAATQEGVYGMRPDQPPEVYLVTGEIFRGLTLYLAGWFSSRFKPQPMFGQYDKGDFRYSPQ